MAIPVRSILGRYIARAVIGFSGMVMAVLAILFTLYLFANEQEDIGVGRYGAIDALLFSLLTLPRNLFDMLPIGALIGALFGLGNLARSSELTVMRASGVSNLRIGLWTGLAGLALSIAAWLIGDYLAPPMEQYARQQKLLAIRNDISVTDNLHAWAKDGNTFVSVRRRAEDNQFGGVYVYRFDDQHHLTSIARASVATTPSTRSSHRSALPSADGAAERNQQVWALHDYAESSLKVEGDELRVSVSNKSVGQLNTALSADFLGLANVEPESLPGKVLFDYIRHAKANNIDARIYETALWTRISRAVALVFVVMLAVPFALAPVRSGNVGLRIVLGSLVGIGFFIFAKILEDGGRVFSLSPIASAWIPTALVATISLVALARTR
jgi:lipopolysaccharide export system permease protein